MLSLKVVVLPAVLALACAPKPQAPESTTTTTTATLDYTKSLEVTFHDVDVERGYQHIRGAVTNNGSRTVTYWKVAVRFFDRAGAVIDKDYTNALERLGPGETKQFELMHREDKRIANFTFEVEEALVE